MQAIGLVHAGCIGLKSPFDTEQAGESSCAHQDNSDQDQTKPAYRGEIGMGPAVMTAPLPATFVSMFESRGFPIAEPAMHCARIRAVHDIGTVADAFLLESAGVGVILLGSTLTSADAIRLLDQFRNEIEQPDMPRDADCARSRFETLRRQACVFSVTFK